MNNINKVNNRNQTDFDTEIRRRCRCAVERFGGLRKFADTIREDEGKWFNRLTDGRVVGFDTEWLNQILVVTGDYEILIPFFRRGDQIRVEPLRQLCEVLNHVMLPVFDIRKNGNDTTYGLISGLLKTGQKLLMYKEKS